MELWDGKRKKAKEWVTEYPDDLQTMKKKPKNDDGEAESDVLFCRFCSIQLTTNPARKPWDQIKEHLSSARHNKLKGDNAKRTEEKSRLAYMNVL